MHAIRVYQFRHNKWYQSWWCRSRLECFRCRRKCQVDRVRQRHQDEEDNTKVQIYSKIKIDDFWSILIKVGSQGSMMLRSEHGRRKGDDRIIANDGQQDKIDELTKASHKPSMEARCGSKSKEKRRRMMKMINGWDWSSCISCNRSQIQTIKVSNLMFFNILDAMVDTDRGDSNVWCRFCTDQLKELSEITIKFTTG